MVEQVRESLPRPLHRSAACGAACGVGRLAYGEQGNEDDTGSPGVLHRFNIPSFAIWVLLNILLATRGEASVPWTSACDVKASAVGCVASLNLRDYPKAPMQRRCLHKRFLRSVLVLSVSSGGTAEHVLWHEAFANRHLGCHSSSVDFATPLIGCKQIPAALYQARVQDLQPDILVMHASSLMRCET